MARSQTEFRNAGCQWHGVKRNNLNLFAGSEVHSWVGSMQARCQPDVCLTGIAPPIFVFAPPPPPDLFLAPQGIFWGGINCCFWPEKTFKFVISAKKSLRISAKTFFFFEIT